MPSRRSSFRRAVVAAALALTLAPALAQTAPSIVLSPSVVPLAGSTGQSVTQLLTLQNQSDQPLEFVMQAQDVVVRDGARVFIDAGKLPDSIAASAVFTPARVRVEPHSSGQVTATFTLPAAMRHRAVVAYFRGASTVQSGARKALLSLGTLFTFSVSDRHSVKAEDLVAVPPSAVANAQLKATLVNDGDEPVVATGMTVILDAGGRMVGKARFRPHRLLPGELGIVVAEYDGELAPGAYRMVATFDIAGKPLTLGSTLQVP